MSGDKGAALADEPFDPGLETGYLRRAPRERELPLEDGAAPFDPGPEIGYDRKRAKRAAKEREQRQRAEREVEARAVSATEQEVVEEKRQDPDERERLVRERQDELARERHRRELEERRARLEREHEERQRRALLEQEERQRDLSERRERAERELEERRRQELDRRARIEEQREREARDLREARRREREQRRDQWLRESEATGEGRRRTASAAPVPRRPAPQRPATPSVPKQRKPPRRGQLAAPTAKVGLALSAVIAAGSLLGAALGLPVPGITSDDNLAASLSGAVGLDGSGTPTGLTKGPYFPVVLDAPADFGESAAKFGANRGGRRHEGQDIFAKPGTPLVAVRDGAVIDGGGGKSFYAYGGGNSLVIYSALDDRSYVYLHMLKPPTVAAGETVQAGQIVGQVGCTGSCDGPHLHFEVRRGQLAYGADTKPLDPLPLLRQWPQASLD